MLAAVACGQTGGGFDLSWSTTSPGGQLALGGAFKQVNVIGQSTTDVVGAGPFAVTSGFLQSSDLFPVPVSLSTFVVE
jgi:hypothetical protein